MTKAIHRRLAGDGGFTLIELMVVVMIIAVLIAIAIPSFLGFRKSAQDRAAQSAIRTVLLVEKAVWLDTAAYTQTPADITAREPNSVTLLNAAAAVTSVSIRLNTSNQIVCITRKSAGGDTFAVWESATAGTYFGKTDLSAACPDTADASYSKTGW
jgi:type IV pilus assembly protein PilA